MKIEECLIFSAGFGTRMGELGKILPKPVWPLFETTLMGAQIEFAMALGCRKIFVNTHHLHDKVENFLPSKYRSHVTFVFEKEILGSGGGVHNLVKKKFLKTNKLLTLNSDAFFFISKLNDFKKIFDELLQNRCLLMGVNVYDQSSYKKMVLDKGFLVGIDNAPKGKEFLTYAGVGLINLEGLTLVRGKSNFFDSVANFRSESVRVVSIPKSEFWDFGTKERYKENIYKLIDAVETNRKSLFLEFLRLKGLIDLKKVGQASYNTKDRGKINFAPSQAYFEEYNEENTIRIGTGKNSQTYNI